MSGGGGSGYVVTAVSTTNDEYINSSEPQALNANAILADDFEDGSLVRTCVERNLGTGCNSTEGDTDGYGTEFCCGGFPGNPNNDGFRGDINASYPDPYEGVYPDMSGYSFGSVANPQGFRSPVSAYGEAFQVDFIGGGNFGHTPNAKWKMPSKEDHVFFRWYVHFGPRVSDGVGWNFNQDNNSKVGTFRDGGSNEVFIKWTAAGQAFVEIAGKGNFFQNQGGNNVTFVEGRWYYWEVEMKANSPIGTANGELRVWVNDCGVDGALCDSGTATRNLVLEYTGQNFDFDGWDDYWIENWHNGPNNGPGDTENEGLFKYDQIVMWRNASPGFCSHCD